MSFPIDLAVVVSSAHPRKPVDLGQLEQEIERVIAAFDTAVNNLREANRPFDAISLSNDSVS